MDEPLTSNQWNTFTHDGSDKKRTMRQENVGNQTTLRVHIESSKRETSFKRGIFRKTIRMELFLLEGSDEFEK